jgi:hypothetical protein
MYLLCENISDMKNIKTFISINRPKKAAIIGSGPLGWRWQKP